MNFIQTGYKGRNNWWMYILTIFIVFIATQFGSVPLAMVAFSKADGDLQKFTAAAENAFLDLGINSNLYLFLMLISFAVGLFALYVCVRAIHAKKWSQVITSREKIDWKRVLYGAALWGTISVFLIVLGIFLTPENYIWNFKPAPFFILVAISFLFIPLQTTFEEVLFRGYLMQGIGIASVMKSFGFVFAYLAISIILYLKLNEIYVFNSLENFLFLIGLVVVLFLFFRLQIVDKLIKTSIYHGLYKLLNKNLTPLLLTSITFGLLHGANPEIEKLGQEALIFYIATGLLFGMITLLDEGLELAIGMHAINNIIAAFLVTTDWTVFQTDALYVDVSDPKIGWEMISSVVVVYPILLLILSKRYGWENWKNKLFGKVEKPVLIEE